MQSYSLFELNEFIRRIIALNFSEAVWLRAEIAQHNVSRGHHYISLLQKEEEQGQILAEAEAVIWKFQYFSISKKCEIPLSEILKEGMEVMLQVKPEFHERYGYKLVIVDVNAAFTVGQLALQRKKVLESLEKEDLLVQNASLSLPMAFKRIAIISTENAAGYQDFMEQLIQNNFAYYFDVQLFKTAMQGENTVVEALQNLKRIRRTIVQFDAVVIIRGGGAKLSLAAFDDLELCRAVAKFPIPVLTGIGHHRDEAVLDIVSHTTLKTPTAVADFLVQHNFTFENELMFLGRNLQQNVVEQLKSASVELERTANEFFRLASVQIGEQKQVLQQIQKNIPVLSKRKLIAEEKELSHLSTLNELLNSENTLKRGYSLTTRNGKILSSAKGIKKGDKLETFLKDGKLLSKVE